VTEPLWTPSAKRRSSANLTRFMADVRARWGVTAGDYDALYAWSVDKPDQFWTSLWHFAGIIGDGPGERVLLDGDKMPGARWFPDATLNYAENLLRRRDEADALVFWGEEQVRRRMSFAALHDRVSRMAQALAARGVGRGDRVAGYLPNMPETIIAKLATASLGAIWSSCSPDFGTRGVLDRFGQIEPKVLVAAEGYFYAGKTFDQLPRVQEILAELPSVEHTIIVPYTRERAPIEGIARAEHYEDALDGQAGGPIDFVRVPFDHPLVIMFSSGTTGAPKCIVHGTGGTLLQHMKEHLLQSDVKRDDRVFYFTTCGWMMWNWLVTALASEATLLLYDGAPFHPDGNVLFDYADAEAMTLFGTSAKYIDAASKAGLRPKQSHDLAALRTMTSTGSPLAPEGFEYVYDAIKDDLHLASISGGTDIISCFALGNPIGPVWRGELQARGLGMAVDVFDDAGNPVRDTPGELVCTAPFPSMPVSFWNDPDGQKYHNAYFDRFPNIWCHGDWVALTGHDGLIIYGRSDAVLNPGGVRIGTAEIYRQVEQIDEVLEAICVGQDWDGDQRVILFVRLREGLTLDDALTDAIRTRIRRECTPRHVPAKVIQIADIPRTRSGKITELAVRDILHGRSIKNREALANPEALELYRDLPALQD
jgi:acetoacetyl-CoA synthetase